MLRKLPAQGVLRGIKENSDFTISDRILMLAQNSLWGMGDLIMALQT